MILTVEGGSSRSLYVESSLWKRLWTCRKTDYYMNINISRKCSSFSITNILTCSMGFYLKQDQLYEAKYMFLYSKYCFTSV